MLNKQTRALKSILKRLERNKQELEKQAEKIEKICSDFDKKMLTLIQ